MTRAKPHPPNPLLPVPNSTTPYWRSQLHPLDEYRSTEALPTECDIAIIGAGMSGVSLAYHLLSSYDERAAPSITLLEARQVCSGATGRNGGHVKLSVPTVRKIRDNHGLAAAEQMADFFLEQMYAMKAVVEKENLEDCEFEVRRSFDVHLDPISAKDVEEDFKASLRRGERWTRHVDFVPESRAEQVTSIKGAKCALSVPACSLWPYKFLTGLLATIINRINLQTNTPVLDVQTIATVSSQQQKGHHHILTTPRGTLRTKKIVFATNAYTGGLLPTHYRAAITPYKGINSHLAPHPRPVVPHLSHTYNIFATADRVDYLNPRPDGSIVVGGGQFNYRDERKKWYGNWDDATLLPHVEGYFGDGYMQRQFRGWEGSGTRMESLWSGIMGETRDGLPHVGRVVEKGKGHGNDRSSSQFMLAGFNGAGMLFIFLTAAGLARIVIDESMGFDEAGLPAILETSSDRLCDERGK